MKKSHYTALGKVYANEVEQALKPATWPRFPFGSKAKVYEELAAMGLLERRAVLCGTGMFRATVCGWELTEAGRLAYCAECKEEPDPPA